ncbi:MAG: Fur family transcriptional regulator [Phycisphaerales bacterium]
MDDLPSLFARHGLRRTPQREVIYRALASTKSHPTAEELFAVVSRKRPGTSLATVYNTLDAFSRRGLCRRFNAPTEADGPARFDADTSEHVHVITDDARVRDVPADLGAKIAAALPPELVEAVEERMGVRVDRVRIELRGSNIGGGRC